MAKYKAPSRIKPVNAIFATAIAAFMMSSANNPKRPNNVATSMKPAIHLPAFADECPNQSGSALKIPTIVKARAKVNANAAKYSGNTLMVGGTAIETPTSKSPSATKAKVSLVALMTLGSTFEVAIC
jgi:hypothetical protein